MRIVCDGCRWGTGTRRVLTIKGAVGVILPPYFEILQY